MSVRAGRWVSVPVVPTGNWCRDLEVAEPGAAIQFKGTPRLERRTLLVRRSYSSLPTEHAMRLLHVEGEWA